MGCTREADQTLAGFASRFTGSSDRYATTGRRPELQGSDTELHEVLDGRRMAQPSVRAAQPFGNPREPDGEAFDVRLIDDRFLEGTAGRALVAPVEVRADRS